MTVVVGLGVKPAVGGTPAGSGNWYKEGLLLFKRKTWATPTLRPSPGIGKTLDLLPANCEIPTVVLAFI